MGSWKILQTQNGDVHKYDCADCKVTMLFLPKTELRVWCCGTWVTLEKETKRNKLPRETAVQKAIRPVRVPFEVEYQAAVPTGQRAEWEEANSGR